MAMSWAQRQWLLALYRGEDPAGRLYGQAAHGGASGTIMALFRRGWIGGSEMSITRAGRSALAEELRKDITRRSPLPYNKGVDTRAYQRMRLPARRPKGKL